MAIYRPILFSPSIGETMDMTEPQIFSAVLTSKVTDYQLRIYDNDNGDLVYDSTKTALTEALYSDEVLAHTVPITVAIDEVRELKWTLQIWNGLESLASNQLREIYFKNYETPTISLSVPSIIESQKYEFIGIYNHEQDLPPLSYRYILYSSTNDIIEESEWIYKESLKYTFEDFLNLTSYKIKIEVYDINNIFIESSVYTFGITYESPSVTFTPFVENLEDESCINVKWSGAYAIEGDSTGTLSYVEDYLSTGNFGLKLENGSDVVWDNVNISDSYTYTFLWSTDKADFSGPISRIENSDTGHFYEIGLEGSKFYRNVDNIITYTSEDYPLASVYVYLIGIQYNTLYIKPIAIASDWNNIISMTWGDLTTYTWIDILAGI